MKLISVALAVLAATTVQAGTLQNWCAYPGQGCYMLKRAIDGTNEVKRSTNAVAEAVKAAYHIVPCELPGQGCAKVKRATEAAEEVQRSVDAFADAVAAIDQEE